MESIQEGREHRDDDYVYEFDAEALPEISDLAHQWIKILYEDSGLPKVSANTSPDASIGRAVMDNGQIVWVQRADRPGLRGYRMVSVVDEPPRTVKATLAALTVLEGVPADMQRLRTVLSLLDLAGQGSIERSLSEAFKRLREHSGKRRGRFISDLMADRSLRYAHALLRHYRPDFDNLPHDDQLRLLEKCCERVNDTLKSVRLLSDFLEYGGPSKDQRAAVEDPHRDVKAALLADVEGLKHREIAKILRIDRPSTLRGERDYSKVRQMVARGKDVLQRAFGPEGYSKVLESMKAELADDT
jgi:hypothetical protein